MRELKGYAGMEVDTAEFPQPKEEPVHEPVPTTCYRQDSNDNLPYEVLPVIPSVAVAVV